MRTFPKIKRVNIRDYGVTAAVFRRDNYDALPYVKFICSPIAKKSKKYVV
ncbi:MAG: hypothetical protein L6V93_18170 [Clostridiales bacterium]|nr:MAG: hypothetical protein L6V93_18170 [Clostridiales bacterium]